jgi:hypothetical protein
MDVARPFPCRSVCYLIGGRLRLAGNVMLSVGFAGAQPTYYHSAAGGAPVGSRAVVGVAWGAPIG